MDSSRHGASSVYARNFVRTKARGISLIRAAVVCLTIGLVPEVSAEEEKAPERTATFPEYPVIEAAKHMGEEVTLIGKLDCTDCMGSCYLYFGSCGNDAVLSVYLPKNPPGPELDVRKLKGLTIAVSGKVRGSIDAPALSLTSTSQIALPKEPSADELKTAIAREDKLLGANPKDADAYYRRGTAREKLAALHHLPDEYRAAMEDYDKATKLDPSNSYAFNHIGDCQAAMQDYVAAKRAWDRAIEASPQAKELLKRSIEKESQGYIYAAIGALDTLTVMEPKNAALYYRKANLYLRDQSTALANENFQTAANLEPTNIAYGLRAANPVAPSQRQMTVEELKTATIATAITIFGAAIGAAAMRDIHQEQRVKQIIKESGGTKVRCPNCGGAGMAYRDTYNSASNPYRPGTWEHSGFESRREGMEMMSCNVCGGVGVVDK